MTTTELLSELKRRGIRAQAVGDKMRLSPRSALTPELLEQLREHKAELLKLLSAPSRPAGNSTPPAEDEPLGPPVQDPFDEPERPAGLPCGHSKAWRSINGPHLICATCHPPASPELVAEWIDCPTADPSRPALENVQVIPLCRGCGCPKRLCRCQTPPTDILQEQRQRCREIHSRTIKSVNRLCGADWRGLSETEWRNVERIEADVQAAIEAGDLDATKRACGRLMQLAIHAVEARKDSAACQHPYAPVLRPTIQGGKLFCPVCGRRMGGDRPYPWK